MSNVSINILSHRGLILTQESYLHHMTASSSAQGLFSWDVGLTSIRLVDASNSILYLNVTENFLSLCNASESLCNEGGDDCLILLLLVLNTLKLILSLCSIWHTKSLYIL